MKRNLVFLTGFLILLSCGSFQSQKTIRLSDGKEAIVFFETQNTESGEKVLVVDYANDDLLRKESVIENHVVDIWSGLEIDADELGIDEAVIKYRYFAGENNGDGEKVYDGMLFTVDRTETGKWSIKRVH